MKILKALPNNVVVAGGFVSNILLGNLNPQSDIDFFFYSIEETEEGKKKIIDAVVDVIRYDNYVNTHSDTCNVVNNFSSDLTQLNSDVKFSYNSCVVNIEYNPKYQLVMKNFSSKENILASFDIGSSFIMFDGQNVLFSPEGVFTFTTSVNILRNAYGKRYKKYRDRGFAIVCPVDIEINENGWTLSDFNKYNYSGDIVRCKYEEIKPNWNSSFNFERLRSISYDIESIGMKKGPANSPEVLKRIEIKRQTRESRNETIKVLEELQLIRSDSFYDTIDSLYSNLMNYFNEF